MPLSDVRVIDFSRFLPGPYCSMMLADLNAEVIRIEQPHELRKQRAIFGQERLSAAQLELARARDQLGRNKRSLLLNLRNPEACEAVKRLVTSADVLLHDYRCGVMERMGFGYDSLRELNPRLVYCAISLCGQSGPYKDLAGHEPIVLALSGALTRFGETTSDPVVPGLQIADVNTGTQAAVGILAALRARDRSGRGQFVDIAMLDCAVAMMTPVYNKLFATGRTPPMHWRIGNMGVWATKDDLFICTTDMEASYWERFCTVVGRQDWIARQYQSEDRDALERDLAILFRSRSRDEWFALLRATDTQVAPVYDLEEALRDPHLLARGMVQEKEFAGGGKLTQIGPAIKLSETPAQIRRLASPPGSDNEDILGALGLSTDQIARLSA